MNNGSRQEMWTHVSAWNLEWLKYVLIFSCLNFLNFFVGVKENQHMQMLSSVELGLFSGQYDFCRGTTYGQIYDDSPIIGSKVLALWILLWTSRMQEGGPVFFSLAWIAPSSRRTLNEALHLQINKLVFLLKLRFNTHFLHM